jgi:hypothetical protein
MTSPPSRSSQKANREKADARHARALNWLHNHPAPSVNSSALSCRADLMPALFQQRRLRINAAVGFSKVLTRVPPTAQRINCGHCDRLSSDGRAEHKNRPVVHVER